MNISEETVPKIITTSIDCSSEKSKEKSYFKTEEIKSPKSGKVSLDYSTDAKNKTIPISAEPVQNISINEQWNPNMVAPSLKRNHTNKI